MRASCIQCTNDVMGIARNTVKLCDTIGKRHVQSWERKVCWTVEEHDSCVTKLRIELVLRMKVERLQVWAGRKIQREQVGPSCAGIERLPRNLGQPNVEQLQPFGTLES